jgi:hypothetical protein
MLERGPLILDYARQIRRDWIDRWPWIGTGAALVVLLFVIVSAGWFVWFLLQGPPR